MCGKLFLHPLVAGGGYFCKRQSNITFHRDLEMKLSGPWLRKHPPGDQGGKSLDQKSRDIILRSNKEALSVASLFSQSSASQGLSPQDRSCSLDPSPLRLKPCPGPRLLWMAQCYWTEADTSGSPFSIHPVPRLCPAVQTSWTEQHFGLLALTQATHPGRGLRHMGFGHDPSVATLHPENERFQVLKIITLL